MTCRAILDAFASWRLCRNTLTGGISLSTKSSTAAKINSNGAHGLTLIGVKIAALDGAMLLDLPERSWSCKFS